MITSVAIAQNWPKKNLKEKTLVEEMW